MNPFGLVRRRQGPAGHALRHSADGTGAAGCRAVCRAAAGGPGCDGRPAARAEVPGRRWGSRTRISGAHAGIAGRDDGDRQRRVRQFRQSYNYLGLNGDARISEAAKAAIDRYGTSVSASRVVSGERPVHRELEEALADAYGTEDALACWSAGTRPMSPLSATLVTRDDAIFHDSLSHNSIVQGALLSGARRVSFAHNDLGELDRLLSEIRPGVKRALVVVEGHYSMDGDVPDLPALVALVAPASGEPDGGRGAQPGRAGHPRPGHRRAHGRQSGGRGRLDGDAEQDACRPCGGYVCASRALIEHLKYSAPGFVYSVGMPPPVAAAALAGVAGDAGGAGAGDAQLQENAAYFMAQAKAAGLDTGSVGGRGDRAGDDRQQHSGGAGGGLAVQARGERAADHLPGGAGAFGPAAVLYQQPAQRSRNWRGWRG